MYFLSRKEFSMATIKVTDENFEQVVLQSDMPFILDAFADWCGC
jgi:thioredoxin-like negative regulator of GroEL